MTPARSSATRTQLGRYELIKELAGTGVASISVARLIDSDGQPPRAFSFLRLQRHAAKNLKAVEALSRSARHAQKLQHPNAITVIETVVSDGEIAIISEHLEAEPLAALRLAAGPAGLPPGVCTRIALDVLAALAAAHELSEPLLHGDLNPHHVVVDADGVARVAGFGVIATLAKLGPHGVKNLERLGYVAPERVKAVATGDDGASATVASDLFSLGVLLWEGLAQRRLFGSKIEAAVIQKVLTAPIPRLSTLEGLKGPKLPEAVSDVLAKALSRDPSQRYATARAMSEALEAAAGSSLGSAADVKAYVGERVGEALATRQAELTKLLSKADAAVDGPATPTAKSELAGAKPGRAGGARGSTAGVRSQTLMGLAAPGATTTTSTASPAKTPAPHPVGLGRARLPPRPLGGPARTSPEVSAESKPPPSPSPRAPTTLKPAPVQADVDVDVDLEPESMSAYELVPASEAAPSSLEEATLKTATPAPASALEAARESEPDAAAKRDDEALLPEAGDAAPWDVVAPPSSEREDREETLQRPPPSPAPAAAVTGEALLPEAGDAAPWDVVEPPPSEREDREETLQRPPPSPAPAAVTPGHDEAATAVLAKPGPLDDHDDHEPALAKRRQLAKLVAGGVLAGLAVLLGLAMFMRSEPPTKAPAQSVATAAAPAPEATPSEPPAAPLPSAEPSAAPASTSVPAEASAPAPASEAAAPPGSATPSPSAAATPAPAPPSAVKPNNHPATPKATPRRAAPKPKYNPTGI